MAFKHTLKRGSTRPALRYPLPGVDLTGATATFIMSPRPGQPATVNAPAQVVGGALEYHWQAGDAAAAGLYFAEFEVVHPGGAVETFPANDYLRIEVMQDLGDGGAIAPPAPIVLSGALVEAGADVASGSASVGISLSGAMAEQGSDTAAGSGTVVTPTPGGLTLTGALVETGADTFAGAGSVAVSMTGAVAEQGVDAAAGAGTVTSPAQANALSYFAADRGTVPWYAPATGQTAAYDPVSNTTYICWQSYDPPSLARMTKIAAYSHADRTWSRPYFVGISSIKNDDHGVPALCITANGYIAVFWGTHNNNMDYAISKVPRSISSGWNVKTLAGVRYNYWRPVGRSDGGIDLFCRQQIDADKKMTLVYRKIDFAAGTPTFGPESTVLDFGTDSRAYSGDVFRGPDGLLWMVGTRSNYTDIWRKHVYFYKIDPAAGTVFTLSGAGKPMPLLAADTEDYILYRYDDNANVTGNIPGMSVDTAGRLHITFNIGEYAGAGGTTNLSRQDVYHMIVDGTTVLPPFKITELDQRYESARCVPLAAGAMGVYYPTKENLRGGGIARKVIPAASVAPDPEEIILAYDPARHAINEIQVVQNAHADFRTAFGEVSQTANDADAVGHRLWAHGDSGFLTRPAPSPDFSLPSGSMMAFDMTTPSSFAVNADGTGAVTKDMDSFRRIIDISGNGNDLTYAGTGVPGAFLDTDPTDRAAQIGAVDTNLITVFRRSGIQLPVGGAFSVTAMVSAGRLYSTEGILLALDDKANGRVCALVYQRAERTLRFGVFEGATSTFVNAASGLFTEGEYRVISIVGTSSTTSVRLDGAEIISIPKAARSLVTSFSLGGDGQPSSNKCVSIWRRVIARSGPVSQAKIETDEAWVQRIANLT